QGIDRRRCDDFRDDGVRGFGAGDHGFRHRRGYGGQVGRGSGLGRNRFRRRLGGGDDFLRGRFRDRVRRLGRAPGRRDHGGRRIGGDEPLLDGRGGLDRGEGRFHLGGGGRGQELQHLGREGHVVLGSVRGRGVLV